MTARENASVALIRALDAIWNRIRELHSGVPSVLVLPAPSSDRRYRVLGHFAPLRWRTRDRVDGTLHEVVVVAEHLDRAASDILETLLHEAAHAMNFDQGIFDCSPTSQYHNRRFAVAAEELGLEVAKVPNYGWAYTQLAPGVVDAFEPELAELESVLIHRRKARQVGVSDDGTTPSDAERGPKQPRNRLLKAICACDPPFIIRASHKVHSATEIACRTCGQRFEVCD